jgi:hypothetical protein
MGRLRLVLDIDPQKVPAAARQYLVATTRKPNRRTVIGLLQQVTSSNGGALLDIDVTNLKV